MILNRRRFEININDYEIIGNADKGSFGTVYKVEEKNTKEIFAAKVINSESRASQSLINREINILMHLNHPAIVKFIGYSMTDFDGNNNATIIMQFAENNSLHEYINEHPIGTDNTNLQKILIGIARGMMYLHQRQIIHRDLKPGNVLIDSNFHPHITDFGYAKYDMSGKHTQNRGTYTYMAPEVFDGTKYDFKADVYSFGILLFEALTNEQPFGDSELTGYKLASEIKNQKVQLNIPKKVKEPLRNLILKCTDFNPLNRPTFEEIFNKLAFNEILYDDLFAPDEKRYKADYYLDHIDVNEVLEYTDYLIDHESDIFDIYDNLNKQIEDLKVTCDQLTKENKELVTKNNELTQKVKKMKKEMKGVDSDKLNEQLEAMKSELTSEMKKEMKKEVDKIKLNMINKFDKMKKEINQLIGDADKEKGEKNKPGDEPEMVKRNIKPRKKPKIKTIPMKSDSNETIDDGDKDAKDDDDDKKHKSDDYTTGTNSDDDDDDDDDDHGISIKELKFNGSSLFNGIFHYLTNACRGGNLHSKETIKVTTNSMKDDDNRFHPKNVIDPRNRARKDKDYRSNNKGGAYVCFDFKDRKVMLSKYVIESSHKNGASHLKGWVIEGKNEDGEKWDEIDHRDNNAQLNGKGKVAVFDPICPNKKFYRYIRLRQTSESWFQHCDRMGISFCLIEFYGKIMHKNNIQSDLASPTSSVDLGYLSD